MKHFLLTAAMLLCSVTVNAYSFQVDGIFYSIESSSNLTVAVTYESYGTFNSYSGEVVIPSTVTYEDKAYTVTSIGSYAFLSCTSLTSITIPESVTSIGGYAFSGCSSLTSITIPEGVTRIGSGAFEGCSILTSITIPESVTSIGSSAFSYCSSLTSITIPEGVTSIGSNAFDGCSSLTSITIPEGVTSIGSNAFDGCSSLTSITIPEGVTSIGSNAFSGCSNLVDIHVGSIESWLKINYGNYSAHPNYLGKDVKLYLDGELLTEIEIPSTVTSIPEYAFRKCSSLTSVTIPEGVTSIGESAFSVCTSLTSINIPEGVTSIGSSAFYGCSSLTSINIPEGVTSIGSSAFSYCSSLTSVTIPEGVTSIGNSAFSGCTSLTSITIPEGVTSIGSFAFEITSMEIVMKATTPPTLGGAGIPTAVVFVVPSTAYDAYISASVWSGFTSQITVDDDEMRKKSVTLTAEDDKSALHMAIGDENLKYVTHLTISGTINSYDFMVMRNKMPLLRHLNMEEATIVYNAYEHYTGYHTEDNVFPSYGLYNCNLFTLTLPKSITSVGSYAVSSNKNLSELIMSEGVTSIGSSAFRGCTNLASITLPEGVTSIGSDAFYNCSSLTSITIPEGVTSIGSSAFQSCSSLNNVVLPPTLKTIGVNAFEYCDALSEVRIPSSVRSIGNNAFGNCSNLKDIYVYTVEPISIGQNTFTKDGNNFVGTLHAPKVSYWDYYYDTQWSQFTNFAEFDEPYDNFYVEGDKVLDSETGDIRGDEEGNNPDAEMGENSGIIVEDDVNQNLGDVDIEHDGEHGGSIIVGGEEGCVNADKLHFHIKVKGGRWYFFCFPFDVRAEDIKMEGGAQWVFRYYDGEERAKNGKGGWKNVTSDGDGNHLKAATGYIFQCSQDDVLILTAKNKKIKKEDKYNELVEHVTENAHDASWNFVGNPYLSYYEVSREDYSAPITVWDGSKYVAIRPGDDDYQLAPFEAFFVQKPEGKDKVNYDADRQRTYHQSQEAAAKAPARTKAIDPDRLLVNITLTDGQSTDRTRVVFNNRATMNYEAACDAAKFSTNGVPQLYTIDSRAVKYAINERPVAEGIVTLGFSAPVQGNYTLAAPRMDAPITVKDNYTGTVHDFSEGDYTFMSEAGTFEDRFTVIMKAGETSIDNEQLTNDDAAPVYNTKGQQVKDATQQGIYIKDNRKVVKL